MRKVNSWISMLARISVLFLLNGVFYRVIGYQAEDG